MNDYEKSLALDPYNVKTLSNLGYSLAKMGNYEKAIAKYTYVLELDPANVHALHNRGISYDKQGNVSFCGIRNCLSLRAFLKNAHTQLNH